MVEIMRLQLRTSVAKGEAFSLETRCAIGRADRPKNISCAALRSDFQGSQLLSSCPPRDFLTVSRSANRNRCLKIGYGRNPSTCDQRLVVDAVGDMNSCGDHGNNAETASTNVQQELRSTSLSAEALHWRDFRARLCSSYASETQSSDSRPDSSAELAPANTEHWAHRIPIPEVGCVLVATDRLSKHALLSEAVIVLLGLTSRSCHGIILNKRIPTSTNTLQGVDHRVLLDLAGCTKYVGGPFPLSSDIHILTGRNHSGLRGFSTVIPGLSVGADAAIPGLISGLGAGRLAKEEINIYVGQVEWECRHLVAEIGALEWWDVVACSSSLLESPSNALWSNIRSHLAQSGYRP